MREANPADQNCKSEAMVAAIVLLVCLTFAISTQHAWEDYWITFRSSLNLATGHGLVYTLGERLHTFTSPLGVLLPAGFSWITGNQSDDLVLWLFRFVSIAALAMGMVLFFRVLQPLQQNRISVFFPLALIALDSKTVDFCTNGMETGLLVFFLALTIHGLLVAGQGQMWRIGAGWGGLMWTRPDSCVYIVALALGIFLFPPNQAGGQARTTWLKKLLMAGLVCAILYLPWFLWAWSYYGSPVPQPITAKGTNADPLSASSLCASLLLFPATLLVEKTSLHWTFLPTYAWFGGWPEALEAVGIVLGMAAIFAWTVPVLRPQTRFFSLAYLLGNFFLTCVIKEFYPWYLPTVAVFGYLTIGLLFDEMLCLATKFPQFGWNRGWFAHLPVILRVSAAGLVAGQLAVTVCVARQLQVQQSLIENGMRRPIGLWLRDHARTPQDTVMLEPMGYIGYYSGLKMLDYPGLASREMLEARKRLGRARQNQAYLELKPDWLVLRPGEVKYGVYVDTNGLKKFYELVQVFDATAKINATRWLPGKPYLQHDQTFLIFHRKTD
jgi:hypothetical protein